MFHIKFSDSKSFAKVSLISQKQKNTTKQYIYIMNIRKGKKRKAAENVNKHVGKGNYKKW